MIAPLIYLEFIFEYVQNKGSSFSFFSYLKLQLSSYHLFHSLSFPPALQGFFYFAPI